MFSQSLHHQPISLCNCKNLDIFIQDYFFLNQGSFSWDLMNAHLVFLSFLQWGVVKSWYWARIFQVLDWSIFVMLWLYFETLVICWDWCCYFVFVDMIMSGSGSLIDTMVSLNFEVLSPRTFSCLVVSKCDEITKLLRDWFN